MAKKSAKPVAEKSKNFDSKTCLKCNTRKKLTEFYINQSHTGGNFHDNWCRECSKKHAKNLTALKEYCFYNNREFSVQLFEKAQLDVEGNLMRTDEYLKADPDKKNKLYWDAIVDFYFRKMNLKGNYKYANNDIDVKEMLMSTENALLEMAIDEYMPELRERAEERVYDATVVYSDIWKGTYSKNEIERLDAYFNRLAENFDITDVHLEDNYREVAKVAMERDQAFDDYRQTKSTEAFKRYNEMCNLYIKLSDTAKLSANKRTKNDSVGYSDLGSLIKRIEDSGALMRKVEFEKDDVDVVLDDFMHILRSFEGESFEDGAE